MSETRRKLRARAERRQYKDLPDEEVDESPSFSLEEKLKCPRFGEVNLVKEMKGEDLDFKFFQENGLETPILIKEQKGLNMKVPNYKTFYVKDVERLVGPERLLDVMDVKTQKNLEMTLKEWCDYFLNPVKKELLNVISLEFSHTELADHVEPPYVIKQLDWVNTVWPQYLKLQQKQSTNAIQEMKYPKVQKYCLMSVKNCYTDFHIDFGGTSVWYHILRGKKVFWLIPPTPLNMELYEQWVLSGKQSHLFFGDTVEHCARVTLHSGSTFFIPSGWIHAVYTPEDSLVFGGNILFSCAMESQIKIYQLENATKVPIKFRYPFFNELHWYVLSNYIQCLTGRCYLTVTNDGTPIEDKVEDQHYSLSKWNLKEKDVYLQDYESNGLVHLIKYLSKLPRSKQSLPSLITNATALINDGKQLLANRKKYEKTDEKIKNPSCNPVIYWLCKLNYESFQNKLAQNSNDNKNSETFASCSSSSSTSNLTSPLKTWGAGLQNVNTKFIEYKNKLNSETDNDAKKKSLTSTTKLPTKMINKQANNNTSSSTSSEIPNSFEKLIAATDISNKNDKKQQQQQQQQQLSSPKLNANVPAISSINTTVNNTLFLTNPTNLATLPSNSSTTLKQSTVLPTNMSLYSNPAGANLIMNRPIFNGPIVTAGLTNFNQPGIIYTNSPNTFNPQAHNLYAPLQPSPGNFNNYNLISGTPMLTTTPAGLSMLPVMNNLTTTAGKPQFVESQLNNKNIHQQQPQHFASSWLGQPTIIQSTQPSTLTKQTLPITTNTNIKTSHQQQQQQQQSSSNKSSKSNTKQQQSSNKQINSSSAIDQSSQQTLNHPSATIIPQSSNQLTTFQTPLTNTTTLHHPFLSTTHKTPVNNMFNLADPNRPNPVINFAPNQTSFITPALNTNLGHPLNQNFIITPVTSNIITGNNLIPNQIYPNFIGNVLMNPATGNLQPTNLMQGPTIHQANLQSIQSQIQIGKPTIKLQRINCGQCKCCKRNACGLCSPCLEYHSKYNQMPPANNRAFSGGQINSEICLAKKCLNPLLPYAAICYVCGKNGYHNLLINPADQQQIMQLESKSNSLLECDTCFQLTHLDCVRSNLPETHKTMEGRMNSHLANSWTCPICVPIKDKEHSNKLNSTLNAKQISNQESINNQQKSTATLSSNLMRNDNMSKSDKQIKSKSSDLNQQLNKNKDQSSKSSFNAKSASNSNSNKAISKLYSSNSDQSNKSGNKKEIYDFDADEDEQPTKFENKFNKKHEQKNDNSSYTSNLPSSQNRNINKKNTAIVGKNDTQQSSIKLPPKKTVKSKLNEQQDEHSNNKYNYESEDKLLLLANTSCQKSSIEKLSSPSKQSDQHRMRVSSISSNLGEKKKSITSLNKEQEDKNNQTKNKLNTPSPSSSNNNLQSSSSSVQLNSKSRNKQAQSVRGRLEQQLKVLKKKADTKNFNFAYRKFVTNQQTQVKTSSSGNTKSTASGTTTQSTASQSTSSSKDDLTNTTSSLTKETIVSNCLKNDCILYPNSNKDTKDALLNKFKNLSSSSISKEDNDSDSSDLGKLEIDTNLESLNEKSKDKSTSSSKDNESSPKKSDISLASPNKNLYECDSNTSKLLPMSYSIEKLASSTSIINKPLEPAPPSSFLGAFDSGLNSDPNISKFGDKFKKQHDLFPNLNRYSTGFSNWSNAFRQNQEKQQSSPSFNYTSNTPVFGAFSRTNPSSSSLSPSTFTLNSSTANKSDTQIDKDKKDVEKDYYTSTEDEAEDANKESRNRAIAKLEEEDTDVQTDIEEDSELSKNLKKVISEHLLMSEDEEEEEKIVDKKGKKNSKGNKKVAKVETKKAEKVVKGKGKKSTPVKKDNKPDNKEVSKVTQKRGKNVKSTSTNKKSKKEIIEEDQSTEEEDQETEEEEEIKPITKAAKKVTTTKAAPKSTKKGKNIKAKQEKESPATKNRSSLNTSNNSSTTEATPPTKKGKQVKKPTTSTNKSKNNKNKSSGKTTNSGESNSKRKSEIDRLLDQSKESSDRSTEFMFTDEIYETIADKVKRNLGRKSKQAAASALQLSSLQSKHFETLIPSTPAKQTSAKKANKAQSSKAATNSKKNSSKKNVSKDDETDIESDNDTNIDDEVESSFEEPVNKKSTGKGNVSKKRKAATTPTTPTKKRKSTRAKK